MEQHGRYVIITKKEKEDLRAKAREVYNYRNSGEINLKKRLPYYIPTYRDFTMSGVPLLETLPYYFFITEKNEDGEYMFEGKNEKLNRDRKRLEDHFTPFIVVIDSKKDFDKALEYIRNQEMPQ